MKSAHLVLLLVLPLALIGCAKPRLWGTSEPRYPSARLPEAERMLEAERDAAFKGPEGIRNVTGEFTAHFYEQATALTPERIAVLRKHKVLLVHGLLGEVGLGVRRFLDKIDSGQRVLDYYKEQETVFRENGIEFERVTHKSKTVDRSGGKIAEAVLRCKKPVLLISHSKGCVDTLDAILKLQARGELDRVAGWVAMQGVFAGAPQAESYVKHGGKRAFGIVAMRVMGGDFDAIRDLTPEARAKYHAKHAEQIRRLVERLPIICMATWEPLAREERRSLARDEAGNPPLTRPSKIQPESSILKGTDYVAKSGINHNVTVIRGKKHYDRKAMTRAFLAMLADRVDGE